jgi:hypothetical protein
MGKEETPVSDHAEQIPPGWNQQESFFNGQITFGANPLPRARRMRSLS